jgi:hypothetical protein
MKAICMNCTESKVVNSLSPMFVSKNPQVKAQIGAVFGDLINKMNTKIKTFKDNAIVF